MASSVAVSAQRSARIACQTAGARKRASRFSAAKRVRSGVP